MNRWLHEWGWPVAGGAGVVAVAVGLSLLLYKPDGRHCLHTHPQVMLLPMGKFLMPVTQQVCDRWEDADAGAHKSEDRR